MHTHCSKIVKPDCVKSLKCIKCVLDLLRRALNDALKTERFRNMLFDLIPVFRKCKREVFYSQTAVGNAVFYYLEMYKC